MKTYFSIIFLILLTAACRPAAAPVSISEKPIDSQRMSRTNLPLPPSKPIEELSWTTIDGDKIETIGSERGKVLVLDFWATYCPPCIEEIPHLNALKQKYGSQGLEIIGLNVGGTEDISQIPDFRKRIKFDYPIAIPEDALISTLLGNDDRIPQTIIFDRDGKMVAKFVSYDESVKREIDSEIEKLLN